MSHTIQPATSKCIAAAKRIRFIRWYCTYMQDDTLVRKDIPFIQRARQIFIIRWMIYSNNCDKEYVNEYVFTKKKIWIAYSWYAFLIKIWGQGRNSFLLILQEKKITIPLDEYRVSWISYPLKDTVSNNMNDTSTRFMFYSFLRYYLSAASLVVLLIVCSAIRYSARRIPCFITESVRCVYTSVKSRKESFVELNHQWFLFLILIEIILLR